MMMLLMIMWCILLVPYLYGHNNNNRVICVAYEIFCVLSCFIILVPHRFPCVYKFCMRTILRIEHTRAIIPRVSFYSGE